MNDNKTIWQRMRAKYRVAVVNEETLEEKLHMRLSLWNLLLLATALSVVTLVLFSLLIWYTPLRNYLPGYNTDVREELVQGNERLDSLQMVLDVHAEYLNSFKNVLAGNVEADSVRSLDSLYIVRKEELLATKSQITEEFMADYEQRGRDNLTLFDQAISQEQQQVLFRPAAGAITTHWGETDFPGVCIQTPQNESVVSVLSGTLISQTYTVQTGWTAVIQHDADYLSLYSGLEKIFPTAGMAVKAGQVIGLSTPNRPVGFQLWQRGRAVDPESVIVF